mgnify:CR=1 FL=1
MMMVANVQMYGLVVEVAASNVAVVAADGWDVVGLPRVFVLGMLPQQLNGKHKKTW